MIRSSAISLFDRKDLIAILYDLKRKQTKAAHDKIDDLKVKYELENDLPIILQLLDCIETPGDLRVLNGFVVKCYPDSESQYRKTFNTLLHERSNKFTTAKKRPVRKRYLLISFILAGVLILTTFLWIYQINQPSKNIIVPTLFSQVNSPSITLTLLSQVPLTLTPLSSVATTSTPEILTSIATANTSLTGSSVTPFPVVIGTSINQTLTLSIVKIPTLRFYELPIKIYLNSSDLNWQEATSHAVMQINQIVPMVQVSTLSEANVIIEVMSTENFVQFNGCQQVKHDVGCGRLISVRNMDDQESFSYYGNVWLSEAAFNPRGALLHELMHAIGVLEHTNDPGDMMFGFESSNRMLTENDITLLKTLYELP